LTELDAIVGIYGAVDEAVQSDSDARARVAQLLPPYRDPDVHWYGDFVRWLSEERGVVAKRSESRFPALADALEQLGGGAAEGRMRARRMFAIAVAIRAFPEIGEPESALGSATVRALASPPSVEEPSATPAAEEPSAPPRADELSAPAGAEEERSAPAPAGVAHGGRRLQELLADNELLGGANGTRVLKLSTWWDQVVATALSEGVIPDGVGLRPMPCSGRVLTVPGVAGPVAALETQFQTDEVGFDAATRFIEPVNWKTCMPNFWCDMELTGRGVLPVLYRYHEVVSSDCKAGRGAPFRAETDLLFNFRWLPDEEHAEVALANYQLSDGRPLPDDLIRVDEGTVLVSKVGPGQTPLSITTTKRIQFSYPFSSEAIALIMCALGYADLAGQLLYCAATRGNAVGSGTDFPGESAPSAAGAPGPGAVNATTPAPGAASAAASSQVGQLVQDAAGVWARFLRQGASAIERGAAGGPAGGSGVAGEAPEA
jgi:hypothetical protein